MPSQREGFSPPPTPSSSGTSLRNLFTPPASRDSHSSDSPSNNHVGRTNTGSTTSSNTPSNRRRRHRWKEKRPGSVNLAQTAERLGGFWVGGQPDDERRQRNTIWGVGGVFPDRPRHGKLYRPHPSSRTPILEELEVAPHGSSSEGFDLVRTGQLRLQEPGPRLPRDQEPGNPLETLRDEIPVSAGGARRNSLPGPAPDLRPALEKIPAAHTQRRGSTRAESPPPSGATTVYDDGGAHDDMHRSGNVDGEPQGQVGGPMLEDGRYHMSNRWAYVRWKLREPFAEWLGMLVLILIGIGATCQTKISEGTYGNYTNLMFAWGYAVTLAIYISGGVSGGHINPVITICLAMFRGFPWRMVPRYILAQIFGAFCGAAILYGNYKVALEKYDPEMKLYGTNASAPLFITMPSQEVGGARQGCLQEVIATGILHVVVLALGDENNAPPGAGLGAFITGLTIIALGMSQGWISGYAINPARDLGPRIFLWFMGYGAVVWHHDSWWWLNGAILSTFAGGILGCLLYDVFIFGGDVSFVNFPAWRLREVTGVAGVHRMVKAGVRKRREEEAWESRVEKGGAGEGKQGNGGGGGGGKGEGGA